MWQLILENLMREVQRQATKQAAGLTGRGIASGFFNSELNKPEAYADRIMREFHLRDYGQAWNLYDSNRAYWEKLYGNDPLNSTNHPASPPSSLLPRQPGAPDPGYNPLNPAPMGANVLGPFGTGGQFVPGSATSSRPLYGTQSPVPPPDGPTSLDATDDSKPVRRLGARIGDRRGATVFDLGAPAVPFVPQNPIAPPSGPATFDERFQAASPLASATPAAASPDDDLDAFRRRWAKAFLEA
ncbi:hypothetical protein [Bradyrhizobium sp. NP1]|uniref:hypothetical protein n=1 Tax=Bradyrhizobium sp. NP1 TaxID=3049772 RepID=UPI0025A55B77|nr:hypothetical protein [Bradyrhizobium sp. NP1]WJR76495.1 hypothetical protein QOU61_27580 [Bradyrhizobium sp. NP1]